MSRHSLIESDRPDAELTGAARHVVGVASPHENGARGWSRSRRRDNFPGRSSTITSSASDAAILPRDPCTTKMDGWMKPCFDSHRWLCACAVSPRVSGRLVRKISSQRCSCTSAYRRASAPGSISSSVSQKFSRSQTAFQISRCCRADSEPNESACSSGSLDPHPGTSPTPPDRPQARRNSESPPGRCPERDGVPPASMRCGGQRPFRPDRSLVASATSHRTNSLPPLR